MGLKWLLIAVAIAFLTKSLYDQWGEVSASLGRLPWWAVSASVVAAAVAVSFSAEQQRALLSSVGHHIEVVPWLRVFYLAQLGKYIPGTAWAYVAQMELARRRGIGRSASVLVMAVGASLTVLLALVAGALVIESPAFAWLPLWVRWLIVASSAAAVVVVNIWPGLIAAFLRLAPRRLRQRGLQDVKVHGLLRPTLWSCLAWIAYGVHLWVLMVPLGLPASKFAEAVGAFALAWAVGFLVIFVPAGVGVREAVLVAVLTPLVSDGAALATAVVSRFLIVVAEAALLALTPLLGTEGGQRESEVSGSSPTAT